MVKRYAKLGVNEDGVKRLWQEKGMSVVGG